ncbi:dynein regulatory complex subunit 2 [Monodelphis domestica]|uniref:dynein regulatory complex subunit 2 n=1 Tax=Monodelphis domestica TaxID=13616 RepID=UPI0024E21460|nr:dynein regulatory complex subunit 2 [Monodelphis domestica]
MPKKGKKGPKTEEEKLLMLQHKMMAEEEEHRKKERLLNQFLKDKLAKEEHNSSLNLNKINTQWRMVLREVKARELRKDIEILSQTFERVVDCKNSVIKSLAKDLTEAEEQYAHALQGHLHNVDELLALQRSRLTYLEECYNEELDALNKEFENERKMIIEQHEREMRYLQDVFLAMEQNFTETEYEAKLEFQSMWDDLKNKNLEEKHFLRMQLETTVEDLWRRFQEALKNYTDATEDRKLAFETLKLRDEKSSKEIEAQMKKIQKIQDSIAILRNKLMVHTRENEEQNRHIREDKDLVHMQLQKLKLQMNQARGVARHSLAKLTWESNITLKALKKIVEKGECILKLAEICRKFETEEEKVLPFYATMLTEEELQEVELNAHEEPTIELAKLMENYTNLENFWKRYNKVKLEQLSLERRRTQLLETNEKLRQMLKQYLDSISVSDEVMSQLNPLLIVNNRSNIPPTPKENIVRDQVYNIIEGAHVHMLQEPPPPLCPQALPKSRMLPLPRY